MYNIENAMMSPCPKYCRFRTKGSVQSTQLTLKEPYFVFY